MPNKHKNTKLRTKLLLSGKLNKKKEVQSTLKYLAEKDAIDKEDINFDFENETNEFGKLDDGDDDTRKLKTPKKRKNPNFKNSDDIKKPKFDEKSEIKKLTNKNENKKSVEVVPKKSKKNKYFFMAHPEALEKKETILATQEKSKFIIDEEKIKANQSKKLKNSKLKNGSSDDSMKTGKKVKKDSKEKLWVVEECSEEEPEAKVPEKNKKNKSKAIILDITDIDKSFKIKKKLKKLEDGSTVEILVPEIVSNEDFEELDDEDEEEEQEEQLIELEECESEEEQQNEEADSKKTQQSSFTNNAMEKLKSSRFRYLNQLLYTQDSSKSFEFFKK